MLTGLLISSLALALLGAWGVCRFGQKACLMDCPNERSSHSRPTPKGGGVGMLAAFCVAGVLSGASIWLWANISIMALIAGYGDSVDLPVRLRLVVQLGLAAVLVLGTLQSSADCYFSLPLILFWIVFIVGTANFYNFMDGIDGIAGITGVVGFSLLALYIYGWEAPVWPGTLSLCMAFSCLGFLPLNMPKARVFMGDVGSILLGAVFAGLVYMASHTFLDFMCMASFLLPFYADELSTEVVRLRDGENLTKAHRRHVYQLLANEKQIAHWKISVGYGVLQILVGVCVLLTRQVGLLAVLGVLVGWFGLFVASGYYVRATTERKEHRIRTLSV
ncbi:MAG: glycosyltransferase family 4 protein [Deltaproteobacteria bacterium]|nr:glycosyltransferase family 4 protein [Deltaproteobacteria bacterium]